MDGYTPKSVQVPINILWSNNDVRMVIELISFWVWNSKQTTVTEIATDRYFYLACTGLCTSRIVKALYTCRLHAQNNLTSIWLHPCIFCDVFLRNLFFDRYFLSVSFLRLKCSTIQNLAISQVAYIWRVFLRSSSPLISGSSRHPTVVVFFECSPTSSLGDGVFVKPSIPQTRHTSLYNK